MCVLIRDHRYYYLTLPTVQINDPRLTVEYGQPGGRMDLLCIYRGSADRILPGKRMENVWIYRVLTGDHSFGGEGGRSQHCIDLSAPRT